MDKMVKDVAAATGVDEQHVAALLRLMMDVATVATDLEKPVTVEQVVRALDRTDSALARAATACPNILKDAAMSHDLVRRFAKRGK